MRTDKLGRMWFARARSYDRAPRLLRYLPVWRVLHQVRPETKPPAKAA